MRVQCISNKCGFYPDLKIGHWYEDVSPAGKYVTITRDKHHQMYERLLFRTESERRDTRLDKILKQEQ